MSNETCARRPSERRDADRAGLGRASTLRQDDTLNPFDVTIDDLSCGGCRLSGGASLAVGDEVSIGLPGIGGSIAHVIWVQGDSSGVSFTQPLTDDAINTVRRAQTLVDGRFHAAVRTIPPAQPVRSPLSMVTAAPGSGPSLHSGRRRLAIIAGATIGFWSAALGAAWAIKHIV